MFGGRRRWRKTMFFGALFLVCFGVSLNYLSVEQLHSNSKDDTFTEVHKISNETKQPPLEFQAEPIPDPPASMEAVYKEGEVGNFEPPPERVVEGPGEGSKPVAFASPDQDSLRRYGCDMAVSDQVSLDRTIPDTRQKECKFWHYPSNLPSASVIVIFHNEGNTTLLRTIHSIINRSPPSLLKELVLVDDASTRDHLLAPLDNYIQRFNGLVKLYRNEQRLGAMGSRTRGAKEAVSEILVILEPHCEVNVNWLPPLIQRIALDRTAMAQPTVDAVHYQDFAYTKIHSTMMKGVFDWGLRYKEQAVSPTEQARKWKHNSEPYGTPTHAGGLFAVTRKHFFDIGGYDESLLVWGAEGFQLSFKQWMCGGRFEMVPCSRVGHIYHYTMPFTFKGSYLEQNNVRTAEGWMDEYKEYLYVEYPALRTMKVNVTDQLELRKRLGCKSFKWFMENVAYDVVKDYPLPPANVVWGNIKERHGSECLRKIGETLTLGGCERVADYFRYNTAGQMSVGEYCLVFEQEKFSFPMCPDGHKHPWEWNQETGLIRHPVLKKCIQSAEGVILAECDNKVLKQQWDLQERM
ncbi:N-acetylgalactosaminyltransferase 7-like [Haliotis rufescens]|uniref:N-acetylgalactosaminyltransferase 7-like n=1 Tax=Haliotis rufescens TaxID=6454 RepID=UPI00201F9A6D|nr:N-acetylgalactosaminyltransferase 7-like [Haliotis rufescens]